LLVLGLSVLALSAVNGRSAPAADEADPQDVLIAIGEDEVSREDVEAAAEENLRSVEMQLLQCEAQASQNRHRALEVAIEEIVQERLVAQAAAAAGQDPETWRAQQLEQAKADVTEQQVTDWYNQNRSRLRGATQEQVEPQIREFLATQNFYSSLRNDGDVDVFLEPFRFEVSAGDAPAKGGPKDAPVQIVEFSDFECPFCQRVNPTLDRVITEYGDKVRLAFRHYPLDNIHANARKAAEASLCADEQGEFWKMHDVMFSEQKELGVEALREKASRIGLDLEAFNECLDSGRYADQVEEDFRAGVLAGVSGTPAIFVNGRPLSGAVPFEQMAEVIDEELELLGIVSEGQ
jgi:predicted DsbA family dithiol-disulfide isomerase